MLNDMRKSITSPFPQARLDSSKQSRYRDLLWPPLRKGTGGGEGGVTVSGTYSRGLFRESGGVGIKIGTGGHGDSVSWHAFGVDPWPSALTR